MWRLSLLSRVVPAFGALIVEHLHKERQEDILQDVQDCYSDIVNIGHALYLSDGESAFGLDSAVVTSLLEALETRLPTSTSWTTLLAAYVNPEVCFLHCHKRTGSRD